MIVIGSMVCRSTRVNISHCEKYQEREKKNKGKRKTKILSATQKAIDGK